MLYLSILLHIYQPPTQYPEITKKITDSSYRLLLKILGRTKGKINLNINASLTEQLAGLGGEDVIRGITDLSQKQQIELTGSAAYHPLLPRLPQDLIERQILLNTKVNQKYFGKIYCPNGLFPPEMAYSSRVGKVLERMGFDWVIMDELGCKNKDGKPKQDVIYIKEPQTVFARRVHSLSLRGALSDEAISNNDSSGQAPQSLEIATATRGGLAMTRNKSLIIFFRNDRLSLGIAFSRIKTISEFNKTIFSICHSRSNGESIKYSSNPSTMLGINSVRSSRSAMQNPNNNYIDSRLAGNDKDDTDSYIIIALDGETFGHHQPGQEKLLSDILSSKLIKIVTISELKKYFQKEEPVRLSPSCWGANKEDMRKKIYWPRWSYPGNPIHKLQWELTRLAIKTENSKQTTDNKTSFYPSSGRRNSFSASPLLLGEGQGEVKAILFDKALHSDQYWWASHRPYWHPEMIRRGAKMLLDALILNPNAGAKIKKEGERLYYDIVETAHNLYGEDIINS